jgi:hypothetical protein
MAGGVDFSRCPATKPENSSREATASAAIFGGVVFFNIEVAPYGKSAGIAQL